MFRITDVCDIDNHRVRAEFQYFATIGTISEVVKHINRKSWIVNDCINKYPDIDVTEADRDKPMVLSKEEIQHLRRIESASDYLISPLVQGGSVVEFYYGALLRKPQGAEILYSETGQDINDFKLLKTLDDASGDDWLFAYVKLPETAKYYAIRHSKSSYTGYGLKIDDITYSKMSGIDHFNVYVDGQLVGTTTETTFTVSSAMTDGKHKIAVTAVFTDGTETVPAYASMNYDGTAIKDIMTSGKPFDVYSTDGKLMRQQTRSTEGLKGVFIIRTDNGKSQSVIMK